MLKIISETYAKNCVHTIKVNKKVGKEDLLCIKMIYIQNGLGVENIYDLVRKEIHGRYATKKPTDKQVRKYKRYGLEWVKDDKYLYASQDVITPIIMHCKILIPKAIKFRSKLGFEQHDIVLTKEQSVILKIMNPFSNEKKLPQHSVLSYKIDLEHKLAIEADEKGHEDTYIDYEIKRQKAIEKELGCEFVRIDPDVKDYDKYVEIGKIYKHVNESTKKITKKSTKKSLIDKISKRLLKFKFVENHSIQSKF